MPEEWLPHRYTHMCTYTNTCVHAHTGINWEPRQNTFTASVHLEQNLGLCISNTLLGAPRVGLQTWTQSKANKPQAKRTAKKPEWGRRRPMAAVHHLETNTDMRMLVSEVPHSSGLSFVPWIYPEAALF